MPASQTGFTYAKLHPGLSGCSSGTRAGKDSPVNPTPLCSTTACHLPFSVRQHCLLPVFADDAFCTMPPNVDRTESAAVRRPCTLSSNDVESACRMSHNVDLAGSTAIADSCTLPPRLARSVSAVSPKKHCQLPTVRIIMQLWLPSPRLIQDRKQRVCWAGGVPRCERSRGVAGSS